MKALSVGSMVESICGKCNDIMGHTIMAMVGNDIIKVECRVCKSIHRFRPVPGRGGEKAPLVKKRGESAVSPTVRGQSSPRQSAARKASAQASLVAAQESWLAMMRKHEGDEARPYAMSEAFNAGDFINHSVFGFGEVRECVPPDKMDVMFEGGIKRLLCNK